MRVIQRYTRRIKPPTCKRVSMATARTVQITPDNTGLWKVQQDEAAAKKATELLQEDLERHHVFFNDDGFHNHISHHILALYGTGASAEELQKGYDINATYQRPAKETHGKVVEELKNWDTAKERVGKGEYYSDFLAFFQNEIDKLGWEKVLSEYLFKGDARSEDMMLRMVGGLLHPIIQLMYGVEWKQPAIVAMALAQAAVHRDNLREFLLTTDEAAKKNSAPMPRILSLLEDVKANKKLATAVHGISEREKISVGVLTKARDEIVEIASRVKVKPEELDERTAEMYHTVICEGAAAAFYPGKEPKFDFFIMHHINLGPIFLVLNSQVWIPIESKVRLLEWKIRLDLVEYAARACPPLSLDNFIKYVPKDKKLSPVEELLPRMHAIEDDGHGIKLFRAVGIAKTLSEKYEDKDWVRIKGDLWTELSHLVVDSFESGEPRWVRGAGEAESWDVIADAKPDAVNGVSEKLEQVHL